MYIYFFVNISWIIAFGSTKTVSIYGVGKEEKKTYVATRDCKKDSLAGYDALFIFLSDKQELLQIYNFRTV